MTPEFEARLQKAIDDGVLPGAVLLARDKSGKVNYSSAIGFSSLDPTSPVPMSTDKIFTLASMTKLLTSIAVLQQLEQSRISLQTDISSLLPDLAAQPILRGIDSASNKPILQPRKNPILLRHLLSHSSGASYVWADPNLPQYFAAINRPAPIPLTPVGGKTVAERCGYPLSFEPGEGWQYGTGLDWTGLLVEKLSGLSLEDYFIQYILSPLNIPAGEITFFPARFSSTITSPRKAAMTSRSATTGKVEHRPLAPPADDISPLGGEAAHGSLTAYLKVLYSILVDDGKLLKPETCALLFEGLLEEPEAKKALRKNLETPDWIVGWIPTDTNGEYDWSAGGLVTDGDSHPHRKRGFLQWGGAFNLAWFIDRTSGVCGTFGAQILQPADPLVKPLMKEFEEIIYSKL